MINQAIKINQDLIAKEKPYQLQFLLPINLNLYTVLSPDQLKKIHLYAYFCHAISENRIKYKSTTENEYVPLNSHILQKMLTTKMANQVKVDLIACGIIETDGKYSVSTVHNTGKSLGYRFTAKYINQGLKALKVQNKPLWKKLQQLKPPIEKEDKTIAFLRQQLDRVKVDLPGAYQYVFIHAMPESNSSDYNSTNLSYGVVKYEKPDFSLSSSNTSNLTISKELDSGSAGIGVDPGDPSNTLSSTTALSSYSTSSGYQHIDPFCSSSIDHPLFSLSYSSSLSFPSPYILLPLLSPYVITFLNYSTSVKLLRLDKLYQASIGQVPWEFKIDPKTGRIFTNLTNLNRVLRAYIQLDSGQRIIGIDIGECQPFLVGTLLLDKARTVWPQGLPEDVQHYLTLTIERKFYKLIMDQCGIAPEERDAFKKKIFGNIFYCKTWTAEHRDNLPGKTFIEHFSNVYAIIKEMKGKTPGLLATKLMQLESEIIIKDVCAKIADLNDENFFVATIHDSILTTEDKVATIRNMLRNAFEIRFGMIPTIKEEFIN